MRPVKSSLVNAGLPRGFNGIRKVECGMWNVNYVFPHSAFRIPHSVNPTPEEAYANEDEAPVIPLVPADSILHIHLFPVQSPHSARNPLFQIYG